MSRRRTQEAVAEAARVGGPHPARDAAEPAGAGGPTSTGAGSADPLAGELRRAGVLPLLVLHFLGDGPSYGNALMERVQTLSRGLIAVNPNTMYPLLRRLEADGLIAGEWEHPERRSRRFYRLTEAGEAERDRLAQAVGPRLDAVADALADIKSSLGL